MMTKTTNYYYLYRLLLIHRIAQLNCPHSPKTLVILSLFNGSWKLSKSLSHLMPKAHSLFACRCMNFNHKIFNNNKIEITTHKSVQHYRKPCGEKSINFCAFFFLLRWKKCQIQFMKFDSPKFRFAIDFSPFDLVSVISIDGDTRNGLGKVRAQRKHLQLCTDKRRLIRITSCNVLVHESCVDSVTLCMWRRRRRHRRRPFIRSVRPSARPHIHHIHKYTWYVCIASEWVADNDGKCVCERICTRDSTCNATIIHAYKRISWNFYAPITAPARETTSTTFYCLYMRIWLSVYRVSIERMFVLRTAIAMYWRMSPFIFMCISASCFWLRQTKIYDAFNSCDKPMKTVTTTNVTVDSRKNKHAEIKYNEVCTTRETN